MLWPEQGPHSRHERPMGLGFSMTGPSMVDDRGLWDAHKVPDNEYQALMECDFGCEPEMSRAEREARWDLFQERIDAAGLTEKEMLVVECVVFGEASLAEAGAYMARHFGINRAYSKQYIHRLRNSAFAKLRVTMGDLIQNETLD